MKGPTVPIVQEAGWAPEPVWTQRLLEKSFASAGDRTPILAINNTIKSIHNIAFLAYDFSLSECSFSERFPLIFHYS
jgi:hypothetical protein